MEPLPQATPGPRPPRVPDAVRVLYLLAVAAGCFFPKQLHEVGAVALLQAVLWLAVGLPAGRLVRSVAKLWAFALLIVGSYALVSEDPSVDRWLDLPLGLATLKVNVGGAELGLVMVLRVLAVVLGSQVVRAGDPRSIAAGLATLKVPRSVAAALDTVLALLGGGGGGGGGRGGGGGGGGGGRRHGGGDAAPAGGWRGFLAAVRQLQRGDVGPIVQRVHRQVERAERHLADSGLGVDAARNVAVVAGVSLTMLGIKALKVLPSIPFAPGHKLVLLTPLYVLATLMARSRYGGTLTGVTMGTVAFLMGDGKYGVFEIPKHVVPGVVTDLLVPLMMRGGRTPGGAAFAVLGGLIAGARFAAIFLVTLAVQAPAVAYAVLVPGLTVHVVFGTLSGYVTVHLVRAWQRQETAEA